MNFNELIENAPAWVHGESDEVLRKMTQYVRQAEKRLVRDLEREAFKTVVTGNVTGEDPTIDLRTNDAIEVRRLKVVVDDTDVILIMRAMGFLEALFNDRADRRVPQFYAETAERNLYRIFPPPEVQLPWEATITAQPPLLSSSNPTNTLTVRFGNLLEADVFRRACMFKGDATRAAEYKNEYMEELALANAEIRRVRRDESEIRPRETANRVGA
jgi:hypothetical protein